MRVRRRRSVERDGGGRRQGQAPPTTANQDNNGHVACDAISDGIWLDDRESCSSSIASLFLQASLNAPTVRGGGSREVVRGRLLGS